MNRFSPPPREINFAFLLVWPTFSFHFFSFSLLQVLDCGENSTFPVSNEKKKLFTFLKTTRQRSLRCLFESPPKLFNDSNDTNLGTAKLFKSNETKPNKKKNWRPQRRLQNYESALSLIEFGRLNILFCIAEATLFARAKFGVFFFLLPAKRTQVRYKSRRQFVCSGSIGLIYPEE